MRVALAFTLFAGLVACSGAGDAANDASGVAGIEPQAYSLFGDPLYERADTTGIIEEADLALAAAPEDVELVIAAGRVRRNFWQYRQAIELYTRAIGMAPDDWRPYRFRGHRYISLRRFDDAIVDLEAARERAPTNWDVAYHLGLAYFLAGRFNDAANEYLRCLAGAGEEIQDDREPAAGGFRSCTANQTDPESTVAMVEWAVRATRRAARDHEAEELLKMIGPGMLVEENVAYYHNLLFYNGLLREEELLEPGEDAPYRFETVGYGVANWHMANGNIAHAEALLERLVKDEWWPGFGRIASEVELARLRGVLER